jgi:hypothetical protein
MMRRTASLAAIAALIASTCLSSAGAQAADGIIASEKGGANGYQHSIERSRFVHVTPGESPRIVNEFGFAKVAGSAGVFATNTRTGLVIATPNGVLDKQVHMSTEATKAKYENLLDPDKHNSMVVQYFTSAGIPKDQIGHVHAVTSLSGGGIGEHAASIRKVDGYASVLSRVVGDDFPVAESVAWARLDDEGKSISEFVYWPAIPAKAIADARSLKERTTGAQRAEYLMRLPLEGSAGTVVIHHSPATDEGPFEALATYDVLDHPRTLEKSSDKVSKAPAGIAVVRHFDVEGNERRLPSERFNLGLSDPRAKQ